MDVRQGFRVSPGKCWCCGTADQSLWVLDTGRDDINTPQHWRVYLCQHCVISAAQNVGRHTGHLVVTMDSMDALQRDVDEAGVLRERAERAERLLADLADLVAKAPK